MARPNPLNGVAMLFRCDPTAPFRFLGTCFAFRHSDSYLTAKHCVDGLMPSHVMVAGMVDSRIRGVSEIVVHESADIAVLRVNPLPSDPVEPFWDCMAQAVLGTDFMTYGFPEDSVGPNQGLPVPRLFKGHYQRFMPYKSSLGRYEAGELSIPCPGGLSGAPIIGQVPVMVSGIVAENIETTTLLDSQEQVMSENHIHVETYRRVVNYGVAVMLMPLKPWLDELIPPRQFGS